MIFIAIPILVCIAGALIYGYSSNQKVMVLAEDAFWTGLLVTLYVYAAHIVRIP